MKILITGGLGFLGSNLATKLSHKNYNITILDNLDPLYGGNRYNLFDANMQNIKVIIGDVRNKDLVYNLIKDKDYVFHFAAQVSYIDGLNIPYDDVNINIISTLNVLESIRKLNKKTKVIFSSSRMVYGKVKTNPVLETHETKPLSLYGINKLTSENYLNLYWKNFGIKSTIFRITNPYGIKQQIKHSKYSILGWFVRQAMENRTISIFGKGNQKRDYIYSEDIINSIIAGAFNEESNGETYNLGYGYSWRFNEMVNMVVKIVGKGKIEYQEWPINYENLETGDFEVSIEKINKICNRKPSIDLEEGIKRMYTYYSSYYDMYI